MIDWRQRIVDASLLDEPPSWYTKAVSADKPQRTNMPQIVALSGGKDSCAMALALAYFEPGNYQYAITPTGNELPVMVAHWQKLAAMLGSPLRPVSRESLAGLIRRQRALPNHRARWCTRILKLDQYYKWLGSLGPCISYVGLRSDEEGRTGMVFPDTESVQMDFPMKRWGWGLQDVLDFLSWVGLEIPERTDCAWCFWQKLGEWWQLWRDHPELYREAEDLEIWVSAERGTDYTFRSPRRDKWPASLKELREMFDAGHVPERSLKMMDNRRLTGACRVCTL